MVKLGPPPGVCLSILSVMSVQLLEQREDLISLGTYWQQMIYFLAR